MNEDDSIIVKEEEHDIHIEVDRLRETNCHKLEEVNASLKEVEISASNGCICLIIGSILSFLIIPICIIFPGLFEVNENEVAIITYNGKYTGTIKKPGYYWINPCFNSYHIVSLRQQNFKGTVLKVNDKQGNPLEIQMTMIWRVVYPEFSVFKVQNYFNYIRLQSEGALKDLTSLFPYDSNDNNEICLLRNIREVNEALKKELKDRFRIAGITCDDAAIVHLNYPEDISKMLLKKQEAEILIASKEIITRGIVQISQNCISELEKDFKLSQKNRENIANELVMILTDTNESRSKENRVSIKE